MSNVIHLFISYAHIDNEPLMQEQGWITKFHKNLASMLSMKLGWKITIWRDNKIEGSDVFGDEITDQFPITALFVSVLTPRYLRSDWCTREIETFCQVARNRGTLRIGNKIRVVKVVKTPVGEQDALPDEVQQMLGHKFYTFDEDERPLELDPAFGRDIEQAYLRKLNSLAWEVADFLKLIDQEKVLGDNGTVKVETPLPALLPKKDDQDPDATLAPTRPVVYLAECGMDRQEDREVLELELKSLNYTILPGAERMPGVEEDYIAEVDRLLDQCQLSIHLVGSAYGQVPDGLSLKSNVMLQNEVAVKKSKHGALQRIIWLPEGTVPQHVHQQAFIEAVEGDAEVQYGADVITGSIADLKAAIHTKLKKIEEADAERANTPTPEEQRTKMIYLICDKQDRMSTIPLVKFLNEQNKDGKKRFEVELPPFAGDATTVQEAQKTLLTTSDAVLLFYGKGDEGWKVAKDNELKRMKTYPREKPLLARFTYLAEPATDDKEYMVAVGEPNLVNGLNGFSEAEMKAFLQALN